MREGLRHHITLGLLLQAVVANGGGGVEAFLDVAVLGKIRAEGTELLLGGVAGDLRDVIRQAEVFGFAMATLDIRDHSRRQKAGRRGARCRKAEGRRGARGAQSDAR